MSKNKVTAGDYINYSVKDSWNSVILTPPLFSGHSTNIRLDRNTVRSYNVIAGDQRKSAVSGIARGLIGGYLFGSAGTIGGTLSAKNKGTYTIVVDFNDGRRSLIEIDDKKYKALIRSVF